jgi:hypothetical protein
MLNEPLKGVDTSRITVWEVSGVVNVQSEVGTTMHDPSPAVLTSLTTIWLTRSFSLSTIIRAPVSARPRAGGSSSRASRELVPHR